MTLVQFMRKFGSVDIKGVIKDKKYVQFHVAVSSRIGLHQSLLVRAYDIGIVGWDVEVSGLSDTSIIEVPLSWLSETDEMWFQILDIHGNHWMHYFNFETPDFEPKPTHVQSGKRLSTTWAELKGK